ncbi:GspH/FimT family pseudopilin [Ideonella sp.]|uniref:GspH/FimT family pseudopilin n=1 Tax=Ideonella sp. TaxID=1929293 RepID=UPI002B46E6E7|nr:GspH/FimT family pseudopilin [Ideonella sp.]HJV70794.1 GspH/FimT family pseudopilin [Ideonella sp.]
MFSQQQSLRRAQRRARQSGVTLTETVVALGIAGTLAAIGVPSLKQFRDKAAVDARYHDLNSALRRARSEAMIRGELVSVCALDGDSLEAGTARCIDGGHDWSDGWLVFVDRDDRGEVESADKIVAIYQAPANPAPVVATLRYLTYRPSGVLLSISAHFRFLPPGEEPVDVAVPGSALVCVNKPGKARVATEAQCRG